MRKRKVWCEENDVHIDVAGYSVEKLREFRKKYSLIRCKKCKKRFEAAFRECHDPSCWHVYLPKHKRYLKKSEQ